MSLSAICPKLKKNDSGQISDADGIFEVCELGEAGRAGEAGKDLKGSGKIREELMDSPWNIWNITNLRGLERISGVCEDRMMI